MTTGFQIRDWTDYTQTMVAWMLANPSLVQGVMPTDLIEGSLERAHLEALAMVMEDYDVRALQAINYSIGNAVYNAFGFPYLSAIPAISQVTFGALVAPASNITIPTGTKLGSSTGVQFITTADAILLAGAFSVTSVPIQAVVPGVAGNVPAGAVTRILYPIAGVDTVVNPAATTAGADAETDASRATRFRAWINTLVRGTKEALQYAAISVAQAGVVDALAVEPFTLTGAPAAQGNVWLFLDDTTGSAASFSQTGGVVTVTTPGTVVNPTVLAAVNLALNGHSGPSGTYIPGWKAAGILVTPKPAPRCPVFVTGTVTVASTGQGRFADIKTALTNAAVSYFNSVTIGQPATFRGLLVALSLADPDILTIQLSMGLDSTLAHNAAPGVDLVWNNLDQVQCGCRFTLQNDGTFPTWNLS